MVTADSRKASPAAREVVRRALACAGAWSWQPARLVLLDDEHLQLLQDRLDGAAWYAACAGAGADARLLRRLASRAFQARMARVKARLEALRQTPLSVRLEEAA